jgi:myo-inositol 2-dehydrogenase/D-chiro-inositol 1-dehydrogenase
VLGVDGATAVYLAEAARASMESGQPVDMKTFVSTGAVA